MRASARGKCSVSAFPRPVAVWADNFSTGVLQELLEGATPDHLVGGTDLLSVGLPNERMTTAARCDESQPHLVPGRSAHRSACGTTSVTGPCAPDRRPLFQAPGHSAATPGPAAQEPCCDL